MPIHEVLTQAFNKKQDKSPLPLENYISSAVLVPLIKKNDDYHILYTQRTDLVKDHKNQISFPGGVQEREDKDLQFTALRESDEEIGIPPNQVEIIGELEDLYTPTGYRITPFVGLIPSKISLQLNPDEIQEVFEVPLHHLMEPKNMRLELMEFSGCGFDVPYFYYKNHTIWGATGRITRELIEILRDNL